jgi:hypothetical protein
MSRTQPAIVINVTGNVEALVSSDGQHYCALVDRQVWCWGNASGLGDGTGMDALIPVPITAP